MDTAAEHPVYPANSFWKRAGLIWSIVLHPVFLPLVLTWFMLYQHPIINLITYEGERARLLLMTGVNTLLFPALTMLLLRQLRFVKNFYMETQRERILPLTITLVFYFWAWYVSRNLEFAPTPLRTWLLGVFITASIANLLNAFTQISLHTLGWGGVVGFLVMQMKGDVDWPASWLLPALLLAGLAGTARLLRNAHTQQQIYAGYILGILSQVIAFFIY